MVRMFLVLVAFAFVLACGGQEPAGEAPAAVDAAIVKEDVVGATGGEALPGSADAKACLELINQERYQDAVTACAEAAQLDPDNAQIRKALAEAQAKSAMPDLGDAESCLKLVEEGKYQDAVAVCAEAAQLNPDNTKVSEALATAKRETSEMVNTVDLDDAKGCLQLVEQSKYQEALAVCAEAVKADPTNMKVSQALATAKRETSKMPTTGQ